MCNSCYVTVVNFHKFKQDCLKNEATLRNYIRKNEIKTRIHLAEVFSTNCVVNIIKEEEIEIKEEPLLGCDDIKEIEQIALKPDDDEINVNSLNKNNETEVKRFEIIKKYYNCKLFVGGR